MPSLNLFNPGTLHAFAVLLAVGLWPGDAEAIVGAGSDGSSVASHVVMLLNRQGDKAGFCTGIAIAQDIVLTAAHCVPNGAELRIHFPGDPARPVLLPVVGVARNPDYHADAIRTRERSIDLALVHLQTALPDQFTPATLAKASGAKPGDRFVVSGYGVTREGDGSSSGTLHAATLATRAPLSAVLLWAEDPAKAGSGACTGDSGGPVVAEGSTDVVALVLWSSGIGKAHCGDLTQSLWLAPHRAWIDRVMQAWRTEAPTR